ncbi:cytochrome b/b6 domain-containing protein [Paraferrimonas haliotis]|uniref:Cytochrome b561 n=1 Tax=Paraferrimonas haliotis TaxID=2013866 RepID=A0AA37WXJ5_9GAMM|nr:cytochrome b/b6 domain-containing protein [Paraferrimonas haliotis]GLS82535.1 cytochrome b561 [Paraferrimonas haliotis]
MTPSANNSSTPSSQKVPVWDLPIRLFHWLSIACFIGLWWSADSAEMSLHMIFGYCFATLLLMRLVWGVMGSDTARFSQFVVAPKKALAYLTLLLQGKLPPTAGHNPLGGYMVVLMLAVMLVQLVTGLFSSDEIFTEGPLAQYASAEWVSWLTWLHKNNFDLLLICAAIHIAAVAIHSIKGEKLIAAMIHGRKPAAQIQPGTSLRFVAFWKAALLMTITGVPIYWFMIRPILNFW